MPSSQEVAQFAQHLTTIQRQLFVYLTSLVGRTADVDDLLQEVNRVLWEKYDDFTPGTNLTAWAYKIAYFQALAYRKTKQRERLRFAEDTLALIAAEAPGVADRESDRRHALQHCLEKLPADDRELVTRRYLSDIDVRDLASSLGCSEKSVYRALARVRTVLLDCMTNVLATEAAR